MRKAAIPTIHFILIFIAYLSPILFDWRLVLIVGCLQLLQKPLFGGCLLTIWQFKNKEDSFYHFYLTKLGIKVDKEKIVFIQGTITPVLIILVTIILQLVFNYKPLLDI